MRRGVVAGESLASLESGLTVLATADGKISE